MKKKQNFLSIDQNLFKEIFKNAKKRRKKNQRGWNIRWRLSFLFQEESSFFSFGEKNREIPLVTSDNRWTKMKEQRRKVLLDEKPVLFL